MSYKQVSPLPGINGGTGVTSLTENNTLIGGAGNTVAQVTNGVLGQVLTANSGAAPTYQDNNTPMFIAYLLASTTADKTGDGTLYTIVGMVTSRDTATAYNAGTGAYIIPKTGVYVFNASVGLLGVGALHSSYEFIFNSSGVGTFNPIVVNPYAISVGGVAVLSASITTVMSATTAMSCQIRVSGSTKTVGVTGTNFTLTPTYFSGYYLSNPFS